MNWVLRIALTIILTNKLKESITKMLSIQNKCKLKQRYGLPDTYVLDTYDALDPYFFPLHHCIIASQICNLSFCDILWKG